MITFDSEYPREAAMLMSLNGRLRAHVFYDGAICEHRFRAPRPFYTGRLCPICQQPKP